MRLRRFSWFSTLAAALTLACGDDAGNGTGGGGDAGSRNRIDAGSDEDAGGANGTDAGNGNGGGPPGAGEGVATIRGDARFELRGPAGWDRTSTSLTVSGTTYTVWSITVRGETGDAELSIRLLQPYEGEAPRVPDDGTFQLGSSMEQNGVSVTSPDGDFTSFAEGSVTVEKDATLDGWSLTVAATRSGPESLELTARVEAIPDRGWVRVTLNGELVPQWSGSGTFNELEPGRGIFSLAFVDTVDDELEVQVQLGSSMSLYAPTPGTYGAGEAIVDVFRLDGTPVGRIEPSAAELVITDFGDETVSGSFELSAESEGNAYEITSEFTRLRYQSL